MWGLSAATDREQGLLQLTERVKAAMHMAGDEAIDFVDLYDALSCLRSAFAFQCECRCCKHGRIFGHSSLSCKLNRGYWLDSHSMCHVTLESCTGDSLEMAEGKAGVNKDTHYPLRELIGQAGAAACASLDANCLVAS